MYAGIQDILKKENISNAQVLIEIMEALTKIKQVTLKSIPRKEFESLHRSIQFIFEEEIPTLPFVDLFEFKGVNYTLPQDIGNNTFGEFVDMDNEVTENKDSIWQAVPGILAVYARPLGEKYDEKKFEARRDLFKYLPITRAESIAGFFLTKEKVSRAITTQFSIQKTEVIKRVLLLRSSWKTMGGLQRLIHLPKVICYELIRLRMIIAERS